MAAGTFQVFVGIKNVDSKTVKLYMWVYWQGKIMSKHNEKDKLLELKRSKYTEEGDLTPGNIEVKKKWIFVLMIVKIMVK